MEAGQLNEKGVKNLHCLQQLLTFQHIIFDFSFYQVRKRERERERERARARAGQYPLAFMRASAD